MSTAETSFVFKNPLELETLMINPGGLILHDDEELMPSKNACWLINYNRIINKKHLDKKLWLFSTKYIVVTKKLFEKIDISLLSELKDCGYQIYIEA